MFRKPKIIPVDIPPNPPTPTFETALSLPPLPNTEFYPITDKSNINMLRYTKNGKKYNVVGNDDIYLDLNSPYFSLGKQKRLFVNSNSYITTYRNNSSQVNFSSVFPNYASVSISDLPLFVKPNNTKGGKKKHKTTKKNKKVKNSKSRKHR